MNGRGRVFDNIFLEQLWRNVKYKDIYLNEYRTVPALEIDLSDYFDNAMFPGSAAGIDHPPSGDRSSADLTLSNYFYLYNYEHPHQSLAYRTPAAVHFAVPVVV